LTTADSREIANSTPPTLLLARRFTMRALPSLYIAGLLAILSIACSSDASRLSSPAHRSSPDVSSASTPAPDQLLGETADLVITKVADRKNVHIGENLSFTITVTNLGPGAAAGVVFGDPLPDPLNPVSFTSGDGTVTGTFCTVESLPSGASATATLVATPISNPARSERRFTNTAFVESASPDPDGSNNHASVEIHIVGKTN